ncbi:MAG: glycosyltransferase, partial [Clostridia bacterium]|nr:glycosyltransferase [Clostridia bacterium]
MTQTQLLSVVIPAYNEEKILPSTIKTLTASLEELKESGVIGDYELLLVNDGSTDGTKEILSEAERGEPGRIRALGYDQNRG